jgi:hypothetical protein
MISRILKFVSRTANEASKAPHSEYQDGYLDALYNVKEFLTDLMWEAGDEPEEEE